MAPIPTIHNLNCKSRELVKNLVKLNSVTHVPGDAQDIRTVLGYWPIDHFPALLADGQGTPSIAELSWDHKF